MQYTLLQVTVSPSAPPSKEMSGHKKGSNQQILNIIFPPKYVSAVYSQNNIHMLSTIHTNSIPGNGQMEKARGYSERPVHLRPEQMLFSYSNCWTRSYS